MRVSFYAKYLLLVCLLGAIGYCIALARQARRGDRELEAHRRAEEARIRERDDREQEIEEMARIEGEDAACTAASWTVSGNVSDEHYRSLLHRLQEGEEPAPWELPDRPRHEVAPDSQWPLCEDLGIDPEDYDDDPAQLDAVEAKLVDRWHEGVDETFMLEVEKELIKQAGANV